MSYKVVRGSEYPLRFFRDNLELRTGNRHEVLPGVALVGRYARANRFYPVESFLYNKLTESGDNEICERVVIRTGFGRGVHPGHVGQHPALYIVGVDIARLDSVTGELVEWTVSEGDFARPKHFSVDCVTDGIKGDSAVLAGV